MNSRGFYLLRLKEEHVDMQVQMVKKEKRSEILRAQEYGLAADAIAMSPCRGDEVKLPGEKLRVVSDRRWTFSKAGKIKLIIVLADPKLDKAPTRKAAKKA